MRLLFLNRSFWPDLEATGQLLTELCGDLSEHHSVTVIAGPSYHVPVPHRGLWWRETLGAISIVRTWGTRWSKRRLAGRLINLGSYYTLAACGASRLPRPDVVIAETDPPLLGLLGAALRRRWRCRFIYYCQDIYPDIAEVTGGLRSRALLASLRWANQLAYCHADLIVVPGRDMQRRLTLKGVPAEKIAVLSNWTDCDAVHPVATNPFRVQFGDKFVVMYSGNLGLSQPLDTVLDAAQLLRDDPAVLFVFIGEGARKAGLQARARHAGLTNVQFFPYQPKEKLAESLGAADLHVVPLHAHATGCLVPSKVYGILAASRPFVAMMDADAEVASLAQEFRVGFVTPPGDASGLVRVIREAGANPTELHAMGRRARALAEQQYDRHILTSRFADLVDRVAAGAAAGGIGQ